MLGEQQVLDLFAWMDEKKNTSSFKYIVSTVGFHNSWATIAESDAWAGFLGERQRIFDHVMQQHIPGVVFITGDSHGIYAVELGGQGTKMFEFSASPLSAFDVSVSGVQKTKFIKTDGVNDHVLYQFGEKRFGEASAYYGVITVDSIATEPNMLVELYNYQPKKTSDKLSQLWNQTFTLAHIYS